MAEFVYVWSKKGGDVNAAEVLPPFLEKWRAQGRTPEIFQQGQSAAAIANFSSFDAIHDTPEQTTALVGNAFDADGARVDTTRLGSDGDGLVYRLNGTYAVIRHDKRSGELRVVVDRTGNQRVYYWDTGDRIVVASQFTPLTGLPGFDKTIDQHAFAEFLCFGCVLEGRTLFDSVRMLDARHELVVRGNRLDVRRYWDFEFSEGDLNRSVGDYAEEYHAILQRAVALHAGEHTIVPTTGGLDARLVACETSLALEPDRVTTFTLGDEKRYDVRFGGAISRTLGFSHLGIDIPPTFFQDYVEEGIERTDGMVIGHTCWRMAADDLLEQHRGVTLYSGCWGEFMRWYADDPDVDDQRDLDAIYKYYRRVHNEWFWMQESNLSLLLRPEVLRSVDGHIDTTLRRLFIDAPADHPRHKMEYMSVAHWWPRRYGRMIRDYWSAHCDIVFPFNDMHAVEFGLRVPLEKRRYAQINRWIFEHHFPQVAKIPYSTTAMPFSAGPLSTAYHRAKNIARYKVLPALTGGRYGTENLGAYVQYRAWLREHNRDFVTRMLRDEDAYADLMDPKGVQSMLDDVMSGRSDDYGKIYNLASFILWRKKYAT